MLSRRRLWVLTLAVTAPTSYRVFWRRYFTAYPFPPLPVQVPGRGYWGLSLLGALLCSWGFTMFFWALLGHELPTPLSRGGSNMLSETEIAYKPLHELIPAISTSLISYRACTNQLCKIANLLTVPLGALTLLLLSPGAPWCVFPTRLGRICHQGVRTTYSGATARRLLASTIHMHLARILSAHGEVSLRF